MGLDAGPCPDDPGEVDDGVNNDMSRYKRKRCECGKAIFATREEAHWSIGLLVPIDKHADLLSIYKCPHLKKGWHLGHDHKKYLAFEKGDHAEKP